MIPETARRAASTAHKHTVPAWTYFLGSAVFHYLGPSCAVLLFARIGSLGVAGLRIWSAAIVFALWRRPWRTLARLDTTGRRLILVWGSVLAVMNSVFYLAIARLHLGTVAAIEFLPVVVLAALGARSPRNVAALAAAVAGVGLLTEVRLADEPLGLAFAFANAALFALYIVLAHRAAQHFAGGIGGIDGIGRLGGIDGLSGIDGLAAAMLIACVCVTPLSAAQAGAAFTDPTALAAGIGVGISSSVVPYVCDQLAMARMARSTYALLAALLPATATVIGVAALHQIPTLTDLGGVALVVVGVALHRETKSSNTSAFNGPV